MLPVKAPRGCCGNITCNAVIVNAAPVSPLAGPWRLPYTPTCMPVMMSLNPGFDPPCCL